MTTVEEVYTPEERLQIHRLYGWTNYIWSSAHARRMQSEHDQYAAFIQRNLEARDTWATVSFEDWQRHLKYAGQVHWDDYVALRDKALEGKK